MRFRTLLVTSAIALLVGATSVAAAGNLDKLKDFKVTGTSLDMATIPQTGAKASTRDLIHQAELGTARALTPSSPDAAAPGPGSAGGHSFFALGGAWKHQQKLKNGRPSTMPPATELC